MIGKRLTKLLLDKGYNVAHLSRSPTPTLSFGSLSPGHSTGLSPSGEIKEGKKNGEKIKSYQWDIDKGWIEEGAIENADYIIHLAGADIADKRWTHKRKKEIIESRIKTANLLYEKVKAGNAILKSFISASAIGYYGAVTTDKIYTEDNTPAEDFLGKTCQLWEKAADQFSGLGIRTVRIRVGVVLAKEGGALPKMALPVKLFAGAAIGSGNQYIPWIHIDDLCNIFIKAIESEEMHGAYNAVSPNHAINKEITKVIAKTLNKPLILPNVPAWFFKLIFGEMAGILLNGSRVSSEKIVNEGFEFKYPEIEKALKDLYA